MNSNENQHETLLQRQQLQQQQQQRLHNPHQEYSQPFLSAASSASTPPPLRQQHPYNNNNNNNNNNSIPPNQRLQYQFHNTPHSISSTSFVDIQSQHPASNSRNESLHGDNSLLSANNNTADRTHEFAHTSTRIVHEQEDEGLALHRQNFQRFQQQLLLQQQQQQPSTLVPEVSHAASSHFASGMSNRPPWPQLHAQLQQTRHLQQQNQTSQWNQPNSAGISSAATLTSHAVINSRQRISPRLPTPISNRYAGHATSSLGLRENPLSFGRVNPYPPPAVTIRSQDRQSSGRADVVTNTRMVPDLNPVVRRYEQSIQQHQQLGQRLFHRPPISASQGFTRSDQRITSMPTARQTILQSSTNNGSGDSNNPNNGDRNRSDMACPYGPHSTETVLPAQAPISIYGPRGSNGGLGDDGGADGDQEMEYILEEEEMGPPPVEVTLNIDIPKSSRPPTEGVPSTMVLNVNPSWHIVFIETIHQQRIRTAVRIQFCPSSSTARLVEHCAKVRRLQTIQVIGYASRRVELSRRIQGQSFLNKGGLVLHLDPASITFNEASYGFTLSLSSFEMEQLSRIRNSRPDIPLPLARQQNSAYCRRNLKEMYYDTVSKDVMITLRPSGEVFYGHSVVLESHAYFRTLIEQQNQSEPAMDRKDEEGHGEGKNMMDDAEAVVDEEGYARPLHSKQRSQQPSSDSSSSHFARGKTSRSFNGASSISQNRPRTRIMIEVNDTSPTVFRAVLHYMYMSHVPITGVFVSQGLQQQQQQQQQQSAATSTVTHEPDLSSITATSSSVNTSNNASESNSNLFDMTGLNALTEAVSIAVPVISSDGSTSATPLAGSATDNPVDAPIPIPPFNAPPVIRTIATTAAAATTTSSSAAATVSTVAGEFPWREVYAVATKYQLSGLIHLSKMALLSRLDVELAISELFEWAYHFAGLIPAYVSFLIEHVDAAVLGNGGTGQSLLWPYHDLCPAFDEIMMEFMHLLNERKTLSALL